MSSRVLVNTKLFQGDGLNMSKKLRMSRIFRPETGNTLILPIDHGIVNGAIQGLENPYKVLSGLVSEDVDAVLLTEGIGNVTEELFSGRNAPARILTADAFYGKSYIHHELVSTPEDAVQKGYDCMKLIMFWNRPDEERMQTVKIISEVVRRAEKVGMPVLVEPLTRGTVEDPNERIKLIGDAARIAYELGADILKVPYPGEKDILGEWVENFDAPVIMLGGGMSGGVDGIISMVEEAMNVGAKGVAIGRNVWQRPKEDAQLLLNQFANLVHEKAKVKPL